MPELPEVETIVNQLDAYLRGDSIVKVNILNQKSFEGNTSKITNLPIVSVTRRAKTLIFTFTEDLFMVIHLKMTGQLIYVKDEHRVAGGHPSHDLHDNLPNKHTRVIFYLANGATLFFNDLRKFGWCRIFDKKQIDGYFEKYGPDATPLVDFRYLEKRANEMPKSTIKGFLLNQSVISGIGNIYADEILYEIKLYPETLVTKIKKSEWQRLAVEIDKKLELAIKKGGTSDSDYLNANGEKGGMQDFLNVYHKVGSDCPRNCGGKITRIKVAGRGTHFCPNCQRRR